MKQVAELLETGLYETYSPKETTTIRAILEELNLQENFFGLLLNGKNVDLDTEVEPGDKVVILPRIAGG